DVIQAAHEEADHTVTCGARLSDRSRGARAQGVEVGRGSRAPDARSLTAPANGVARGNQQSHRVGRWVAVRSEHAEENVSRETMTSICRGEASRLTSGASRLAIQAENSCHTRASLSILPSCWASRASKAHASRWS